MDPFLETVSLDYRGGPGNEDRDDTGKIELNIHIFTCRSTPGACCRALL
jgi:hypothetical protein